MDEHFAQDPLELLQLPRVFPLGEALHQAYIKRQRSSHPDYDGDCSASSEISKAYEFLRNPINQAAALLLSSGCDLTRFSIDQELRDLYGLSYDAAQDRIKLEISIFSDSWKNGNIGTALRSYTIWKICTKISDK